jgi:hypothetical protein
MPGKKRSTSTATRGRSKRARGGDSTADEDSLRISSAPPRSRQVSHYVGKLQFNEDDLVKLQEPLKGTWMQLKMYAVTASGDKLITLDSAFPLKVSLMCDGGRTEVTETNKDDAGLPALEVKGNRMTKEGTATIQLKINVLGKDFQSRQFALRVQPADDANVSGLEEVQTPPFIVITQRLKVTDLGGEADGLIGTFYKDEGGKEKFLEYNVALKDARGVCTTREVPLQVTLHYDIDDRPEANKMTNNGKQTLMTIDQTQNMVIQNGKATVKIRINDVSKNHYSNGFVVRVSPVGEDNNDVAAGWSGTTMVKSKRAKNTPMAMRKKQRAAELMANGRGGNGSSPYTRGVQRSNSGSSGSSGSSSTSSTSTSSSSSSTSSTSTSSSSSTSSTSSTSSSIRPQQSSMNGRSGSKGSGSSSRRGPATFRQRKLALPHVPDEVKRTLAARGIVKPSTAVHMLSEWGNALTSSLAQLQQNLQPMLVFTQNFAYPLLTQVGCCCSILLLLTF